MKSIQYFNNCYNRKLLMSATCYNVREHGGPMSRGLIKERRKYSDFFIDTIGSSLLEVHPLFNSLYTIKLILLNTEKDLFI
jgi:hypothetical protein